MPVEENLDLLSIDFFDSFWFSVVLINELGIRIVPSEFNLEWLNLNRNFSL